MDYEYYYYNARNRYYNACAEVTSCENRMNELKYQQQQNNTQINQLTTDINNNQEAFEGMSQIIQSEENLNTQTLDITNKTSLASENFSGMVNSSDIINKDLNNVYNAESTQPQNTLAGILESIKAKKTALETLITELQTQLSSTETELEEITSGIGTTESNLQSWMSAKTNASIDMEFYRRKMNETL